MIEDMLMVRPGEVRLSVGGMTLATLGLGSCVAIILDDPILQIGGLAHALLPEPPDQASVPLPGRFATTAVPYLVERIVAGGGDPGRLRARVVGGASMFAALLAPNSVPLGTRNAEAARASLKSMGIPVIGEDVGGQYGRSVYFSPSDGRVLVKSVYAPEIQL